jgi:hypothetical protein
MSIVKKYCDNMSFFVIGTIIEKIYIKIIKLKLKYYEN